MYIWVRTLIFALLFGPHPFKPWFLLLFLNYWPWVWLFSSHHNNNNNNMATTRSNPYKKKSLLAPPPLSTGPIKNPYTKLAPIFVSPPSSRAPSNSFTHNHGLIQPPVLNVAKRPPLSPLRVSVLKPPFLQGDQSLTVPPNKKQRHKIWIL